MDPTLDIVKELIEFCNCSAHMGLRPFFESSRMRGIARRVLETTLPMRPPVK
jgi:hypothetical protein